MAHQRRFPPRAVAGHRPRSVERDVLAGRRHARLARARREHAAKSRAGVAQEVVGAGCRAGQRDARQDRAGEEGRGQGSGSAPTTANGCASRSSRSRRSCRTRKWPKWSPTSGARSASRPTCREMERGLGFARARQQRTSHVRLEQWRHGVAVPVPHLGHPGRRPSAALGPAYAAWYASGGTQGTKPDDPNILKILDLYTEAAGLKAEGRNRNAQEIWKILVDQQYGIGTVGPVAGGTWRAAGVQPAWQYRRAGLQRAALPHARQLPSRKPGTSRR